MKKFKSLINCTAAIMFGMFALQVPAMAQADTKLTDPQIVSVAVVATQIDMDYARIAKERSKNEEVLALANMMTKDHQSVIDQAVALAKKLNITPMSNATGEKMFQNSERTKHMLRIQPGIDFDKAYIASEIAYQKAVITAVEGTLIPDAQNPELKKLLQNVVPVLKAHLEHAEMMQRPVATK